MTEPIVPLDRALARLGIAGDAPEAPRVRLLLDAVSDEVRAMTRRALEGVPTVYREVLEPQERMLLLPHVPVTHVLSIRPVAFDGTRDHAYDPLDLAGGAVTTLAAIAAAGATNLKVTSVSGIAAGDLLRVGSGLTREVVHVTAVGTAGSGGTGVTVEPALLFAQASGAPLVEVAGATAWRLANATRGRIELAYRRRYLEATWRVSGEIPAHVAQAGLEWVEDRWTTADQRDGAVISYRTGDDSETYDPKLLAGRPPSSVARALGLTMHLRGATI